jgi:hypothetical protein
LSWPSACSWFIALMMEAVHTSETLVYFNKTAWRYNPQRYHLNTLWWEPEISQYDACPQICKHCAGHTWNISVHDYYDQTAFHSGFNVVGHGGLKHYIYWNIVHRVGYLLQAEIETIICTNDNMSAPTMFHTFCAQREISSFPHWIHFDLRKKYINFCVLFTSSKVLYYENICI